MKVSAAAKVLFRQALRDGGVQLSISDTEVDKLVRHVRGALGKVTGKSIEEEQSLLVSALLPLRLLLEKDISTKDHDEQWWATILWNLFTSAVNHTQGAEKVSAHADSEELWQDMIIVLLGTETITEDSPMFNFPFWGRPWLIGLGCEILGFFLFYITSWFEAGRPKLVLATFGLIVCASGIVWYLAGWPLFGKLRASGSDLTSVRPVDPEKMSLKSRASSQGLRAENLRLKSLLDEVSKTRDASQGSQQLQNLGVASGPDGLMKSLEALGKSDPPKEAIKWEKGAVILVGPSFPVATAVGQRGVVFGVSETSLTLKLLDGSFHHGVKPTLVESSVLKDSDKDYSLLMPLIFEALDLSQPPTHEPGLKVIDQSSYTPLATGTVQRVMIQAKQIKESLVQWSAKSALFPHWPKLFWADVGRLEPLDGILRGVLLAHGYLGDGVGVVPRSQDLEKKLEELSHQGAPSHSSALFKLQGSSPNGDLEDDGDNGLESWENALSSELKRAAPEIYLAIRGSGVRNTRDWINSMFPIDRRNGPQYLELFNCATLVDFEITKAKTGTQSEILKVLAQSDVAEVNLRRLAAWIHENRTGDRAAATAMLAVKPSSMAVDIGPQWLVSEASTYSQSEHKRKERAKAQKGKGKDGGSKGDGKGKGKKNKEGQGGPQKFPQG